MAVTKYNPTTPGRRGMTSEDYSEITTKKPLKSLTKSKKQNAGRNNTGRITVRHRGGGVKRHYRLVNHNLPAGTVATIEAIEYDPNRSANIALITYKDGEKAYIIAPKGLTVGTVIESGENVDIKVGNALPIMNIPVGTVIHNLELRPGKGASLARSAGASAQILGREEKYVLIRLGSGETRRILGTCRATIGVVGNEDYSLVKIGKAGRTRHKGFRPTVRGSVMNPNDHPHGGGEGRAPIGRSGPMTPWGKPALGYKTRKNKKESDKYIVTRRKK